MKINSSVSINLLRIALFIVFLGLFLPIGCKSNGYQIAQGIMGHNNIDKGVMNLSSINDLYAYLLFAVFIIAVIGIVITFISNIDNNFTYAFLCLVLSFVFMFIIMLKLRIYYNFNELSFFINSVAPIKIKLLVGGYLMVIGYIGGLCVFVLNKAKIIK